MSSLTGKILNLIKPAVTDSVLQTIADLASNFQAIDDGHSAHLAETMPHDVAENLKASKQIEVTSIDDATSTTSAPLKSAGGLAVAKRAYLGDTIVAYNGINLVSTSRPNLYKKRTGFIPHGSTNWRTLFTRVVTEGNVWGSVLLTVFTLYGTPSSSVSVIRVLVLPNKTFSILSKEGNSGANGYDAISFQWSGEEFQIMSSNISIGIFLIAESVMPLVNWVGFSSIMEY